MKLAVLLLIGVSGVHAGEQVNIEFIGCKTQWLKQVCEIKFERPVTGVFIAQTTRSKTDLRHIPEDQRVYKIRLKTPATSLTFKIPKKDRMKIVGFEPDPAATLNTSAAGGSR